MCPSAKTLKQQNLIEFSIISDNIDFKENNTICFNIIQK